MGNTVTPLHELQRRVPEAGRIRFGVKTATAMKALDTWRFTSRDLDQIVRLADLYGGKPGAWNPGRGRAEWEVITEASVIDVVVPPTALGNTPIYELWSAAGLQRRCDGETLEIPTRTPEGAIVMEQPCICETRGTMVCKPITRLSVLIPGIPFTGIWMMEAKGWNAAKELPGMVDMVVAIQDQGFAKARLGLEKRTKTDNGKTTHFTVPVLTTPATIAELAEGGARLMSIAAPPTPALRAPDSDAEVTEAEIVEDDDECGMLIRTIYGHANALGLSTDELRGLVYNVSSGDAEALDHIDRTQLRRIVGAMERVLAGEGHFVLEGRRTALRTGA